VNQNDSSFKVVHLLNDNRFEVDLGQEKAILIYMIKAELFILLHTEVPPVFEGQGIAGKMARAALEYARNEGFKVRSYCSYTTGYIERHPEFQDILG
jgi:predicted GNAT family acetyltransferase